MRRRTPLFSTLALLALVAAVGATPARAGGKQDAPYDIIVVGGGPGGVTAALEAVSQAREAGLPDPRVLIIEKRGERGTRQNYVGLHTRTIQSLTQLGVDLDAAGIQRVKGETLDDRVRGVKAKKRFRATRSQHPGHIYDVSDLARSNLSAATSIPINDLETALRKAAVATGAIEFHYHTAFIPESELEPDGRGWRFTAKRRNGRMREYRARYVVVADGARSLLRDRLGVKMSVAPKYKEKVSRYAIGVLDKPGNGWADLKFIPDETGQIDRAKVFKMSGKTSTAVAAEVPPGTDFHTRRELNDWWRDRASHTGMTRKTPLKTKVAVFDLWLGRASRCVVRSSAFLLGDAVRTGHPAAEAFLQAATRDGARFGVAYVRGERASTARGRAEAAKWYAHGTSRATSALHAKAAARFPRRIGMTVAGSDAYHSPAGLHIVGRGRVASEGRPRRSRTSGAPHNGRVAGKHH